MMEIPEAKIGDVFEVVTGSTPSTALPEYWEGGNIKWVTPLDLGKLSSPFISQTSRNITEQGLKNSSATLVPAGSVIISTRAPIGYLAVLTEPMAFNQGCKALLPRNGNPFEPLYVYYQLQTKVYEMNRLGSGSTFKEISKEKLESIRVQLPSLPIQKQIAAILEKADAAREKRRQANQLTEQFLQSAFLQKFGNLYHNSRNWRVEKIGNCVTRLTNGYVGPTRDIYRESGIPYILAKHIEGRFVKFANDAYVTEEFNRKNKKSILKTGDVLLVQSGVNTGEAGIV